VDGVLATPDLYGGERSFAELSGEEKDPTAPVNGAAGNERLLKTKKI
jgi:hypothetical protein